MRLTSLRHGSRIVALSSLVVAALSAQACSASHDDTTSAVDTPELRALAPNEIVGTIAAGETSAPIAYTNPPRYRALSLAGTAGQSIDAWVRSSDGDAMGYLLDATFKSLATNDDADGSTKDAHLHVTLPSTGTYYVAFRERDLEPATFTVSLSATGADAGVDASPPPPPPPVAGTPCATVDEIAAKPCGVCGTQEAICLSNDGNPATWSEWGVCHGELPGGCVPGTQTTEACGNCGTRVVTCTQYCARAASACVGEPANSCAPSTTELTPAACATPGTYRQRACSLSCTWGPFSATCNPAAMSLTAGTTVGAVVSTVVALSTAQVAPRLGGACTTSAELSPTSTPYAYVTVVNSSPHAMTASVYNTRAPGGGLLDTVLAAYAAAPPNTDAERKACLRGVADFGTPALTGDADFASLDGSNAVPIPAGGSVVIYVAQWFANDPAGPVQLNVKTESIE